MLLWIIFGLIFRFSIGDSKSLPATSLKGLVYYVSDILEDTNVKLICVCLGILGMRPLSPLHSFICNVSTNGTGWQ